MCIKKKLPTLSPHKCEPKRHDNTMCSQLGRDSHEYDACQRQWFANQVLKHTCRNIQRVWIHHVPISTRNLLFKISVRRERSVWVPRAIWRHRSCNISGVLVARSLRG